MQAGNRAGLERSLARALSRHIGYTSGAYDLDRILSVLDFFTDKPSSYKEELIPFLQPSDIEKDGEGRHETEPDLTPQYLAEVLNFASSMRIVETVSPKDANLQRIAPTELGRSLLGARAVSDHGFYQFYLSKIVILADADSLFPVLEFFAQSRLQSVPDYFLSFQEALRARRLEWLVSAFPEPVLFDRVAAHVTWLSRPKAGQGKLVIDIPTPNTARHHATPRQGWISQLGMFDRSTKRLTPFGHEVVRALCPSGEYFWLGPEETTQDALRIDKANQAGPPYEDTLTFSAEALRIPTPAEISDLIEDLARVMLLGYSHAKLIHAAQASLILPIEYIRYRSYKDGIKYEWASIMKDFFRLKKGQFERLSARLGQIGFYRPHSNN